MVVGVFEYKCTFDGLYELGNKLEGRILTAVIIAVVFGVVVFILQELFIKMIRRKQGNAGAQVTESAKARDKRIISSAIGYCFAIILVVLLVMSRQLSSVYVTALKSERADAMQKCAVSSAMALSYTTVSENMSYMLPVYSYDKDKQYMISVYTMAGDSFLRLYSSTASPTSNEQYYLTGVGDQYINCFQLQETAFTQRTEAGKQCVCAISPIISSENTVSGILEIMMPKAEFQSSVNGMSPSIEKKVSGLYIIKARTIVSMERFTYPNMEWKRREGRSSAFVRMSTASIGIFSRPACTIVSSV